MSLINLETIKPQELELLTQLRAWNLVDDFCSFLTRPDAHSRLVTGVMGWQWEDNFQQICELRGLSCKRVGLNTKYDVLVNGKRVQCKFSNSATRVDIRNKDKNSNRRYSKDDFDFLALRVHPTTSTFIIPVERLIKQGTDSLLGSIDVNAFAEFLDKYEVLHAVQDLPEMPEFPWSEEIAVSVRASFLGGEEEKAAEGWQGYPQGSGQC